MRLKMPVCKVVIGLLLLMTCFHSHAQDTIPEQCGTMPLLQQKFKLHPALKAKFEAREKQFKATVNQRILDNAGSPQRAMTLVTVPIVFHIVLSNPDRKSVV